MNENKTELKKQVQETKVAVVVSTWVGNPEVYLSDLTASMRRFSAGRPYDLFLSANGETFQIPSGLEKHFKKVFIRENVGFNLGAWDFAWRRLPQYSHFLFIQDDCTIRRRNWVSRFVRCFEKNADCGLVGEYFNSGWDHPWNDLTTAHFEERRFSDTKRERAIYYYKTLESWGIDPGERASHLTSVVHFTSRKILEEIDGYNIGHNYQDAIAAEIGFSRKIRAKGYQLIQVGRGRHSLIAHPQWPTDTLKEKLHRVLMR